MCPGYLSVPKLKPTHEFKKSKMSQLTSSSLYRIVNIGGSLDQHWLEAKGGIYIYSQLKLITFFFGLGENENRKENYPRTLAMFGSPNIWGKM